MRRVRGRGRPASRAVPRAWWPALALLLLAASIAPSAVALEVPFLSGRVVDLADLLPPQAEASIDVKLQALEKETGAQLVVLTVPTLEGDPLEDFAIRVAQTWRLGREGVDDGALLLVAREERGLRMEVGYGLEPKLTDITSRRILDEIVVPRFRDGDFAGGIEAGVDAVATVIRGGDPLPPPAAVSQDLLARDPGGKLFFVVVFALFGVPFTLSALRTPGCAGWFLYLFLTPFITMLPYQLFGRPGLVAPVLWLVGFPILKVILDRRPRPPISGSRRRRGGWVIGPGGFGGGGFGGGGFSGGGGGGGFSGGGGSFGGGGASSSW